MPIEREKLRKFVAYASSERRKQKPSNITKEEEILLTTSVDFNRPPAVGATAKGEEYNREELFRNKIEIFDAIIKNDPKLRGSISRKARIMRKMFMGLAVDAGEKLEKIEKDLKQLEDKLEAAGAPWTPGRIPDWEIE